MSSQSEIEKQLEAESEKDPRSAAPPAPDLDRLPRNKLLLAQSNMMCLVGIAIGIDAVISEETKIDGGKSYFANAIEIFADVNDELLKDMVKHLQNEINARLSL